MELKELYKVVKKLDITEEKKENKPIYISKNNTHHQIVLYSNLSDLEEREIIGRVTSYLLKKYNISNEKISVLVAIFLSNLDEKSLNLLDKLEVEISIRILLPVAFENLLYNSKKIISKDFNRDELISEGKKNFSDFYNYIPDRNFKKFLSYKERKIIPNFFMAHLKLAKMHDNNFDKMQDKVFDKNNFFTKLLYEFCYELYDDFRKNNFKIIYEWEVNYETLKNNYYISYENILSPFMGGFDFGLIKYQVNNSFRNQYFYLPNASTLNISVQETPYSNYPKKFNQNYNEKSLEEWFDAISNYINIKKRINNIEQYNLSQNIEEYLLIFNISLLESIFLRKEDNKEEIFVKRLAVFTSLSKKENFLVNKSLFKKLYKFRSMAVHGNISFNKDQLLEIKKFLNVKLVKLISSIDFFLLNIIEHMENTKRKKWLDELDLIASKFELDKNVDEEEFNELLLQFNKKN